MAVGPGATLVFGIILILISVDSFYLYLNFLAVFLFALVLAMFATGIHFVVWFILMILLTHLSQNVVWSAAS